VLKAPVPTRAARAVVGWFAGAFAFECIAALARGSYSVAGISGILAVAAALVSLKPDLTPDPQWLASLNRLGADARWWVAVNLLSLAAVALSPWVQANRIAPPVQRALAAVNRQVVDVQHTIGTIEHGGGTAPGLDGLEARLSALEAKVKSLGAALVKATNTAAQASAYHEHAAQKLVLESDLNQLDTLFREYKDIGTQILVISQACPPHARAADVHGCRSLSGLSQPYHRTVVAMTRLIARDFGKTDILRACGAGLWPLVTDAAATPDAAYRQHRTQIQCIERQVSDVESVARAQIQADDLYIKHAQPRFALGD
jgi:BMFP domain-containing protein YqiC